MPKPLPPPDPNLSHVNWISFARGGRTEPVSKSEETPVAGNQPGAAEEGFSILLSALRRSQTGLAAQSRVSGVAPPARKTEAKGER
jgi:hypothetical protein